MQGTQLQAVVFDWAGTVIDHGCLAPMGAFVRGVRASSGVAITIDEARGPMGLAKRDHIRAVLALPRVREAWRARARRRADRGRHRPGLRRVRAADVEVVTDLATLIDGVAEVVARLRARGLKHRLDHRLHARDHGAAPAGRGRAGLSPPTISSAPATSPPAARRPLDDVQDLSRSRGLAGMARRQGRRHRGRHRRRAERRLLDGRRRGDRQRVRPLARRHWQRSLPTISQRRAQRRRSSAHARRRPPRGRRHRPISNARSTRSKARSPAASGPERGCGQEMRVDTSTLRARRLRDHINDLTRAILDPAA